MRKILVAWLGKTDLRAPAESESVGQGPIAQALASRDFDEAFFLSPARHDGVPDEEFSREDADLAIAMTAALLRLAPRWGAEQTENASGEDGTP